MDRRKLLTNSAAFGLAPVLPPRAIKPLLAPTSVTRSGNSADADRLEDERNPLIPPDRGSIPVAFPISQGAVIIDFCGPWEVFHSAAHYPDIQLKRGARFVEDGNLASAGGLSSGIDLAIRVIERYFGREAAERTAYAVEYQGKGWQNPNSNGIYAH